MSNVLRLAIVDPVDTTRSSLKSLLLGIDTIWLEAECSRYEFFIDVALQTKPDIAIVSLDADSTAGLELIAQITQDVPNCSVLVVSSSQEGSLILQAMRNGAKEFLSSPLKLEDFLTALGRVQQTHAVRDGDGRSAPSQVYTVAGVGGGVGCTSLAVNLACALAKNERNSVAIIDLDLALGDADVWLDIIPDYTIQDVAENVTRLDYSLLKRSLTQHSSGAFLLPRPVQIEDKPLLGPDELKRIISLLKATFTHLVIDVSKNFSPLDIAAMTASDSVFLMTQLDLPCLRNVVRLMQFFDLHEGLTEKIRVVVNRLGLSDSQISLAKALETIGRDVYWQLPNDYSNIVESRNNGVPLIEQAPKAKLTRSIIELAQSLDPSSVDAADAADEGKPKKGLFSFLGSKSS